MSAERNPFTHRVAMQLAAVEAELAHPDVSPYRAAELRQRRRFLQSLESPERIRVRREPEPVVAVVTMTFGRRPSRWRWRSAGSIAARIATALGTVAILTFLWLLALDWALWGLGL